MSQSSNPTNTDELRQDPYLTRMLEDLENAEHNLNRYHKGQVCHTSFQETVDRLHQLIQKRLAIIEGRGNE